MTGLYRMTTYQWMALVFVVWAIALFAMSRCADAAECLPSAQAVWSAHNGAHATWNNVDGRKCWRAGKPDRREVVQQERSPKRVSARFVALSAAIPLPRPRLDWEILHPEQYTYAHVTEREGRLLDICLFVMRCEW